MEDFSDDDIAKFIEKFEEDSKFSLLDYIKGYN